jgi:HEAT repeat protein
VSRADGSVGEFTTDVALVVRSWDPWMSLVTGLTEADACGRPLAELFPELGNGARVRPLERVAKAGTVEVLSPAFHHYLIPCPTREPSAHFTRMQQHVTVTPVRDGAAIVGVAVRIEDVTVRRDLEADLAAQLASPDPAVRLHATRRLGELGGGDDVVAPLANAMADENWRVRRAAAEGLAKSDTDSMIDALLSAVRDRNRDAALLNAAVTALVRASRDVVPAIIPLLDDASAEVRTYAALTLGLLEDRRAVPALLRALDDSDDNVRFHAVEALGRIRPREAADRIAAIAESRDFSVAFAALDALRLIGEPSVAPQIVRLLDDSLLQTAAAEALGCIGSEEVVAPLARLIAMPGAPVAEGAAALATLHARFEEGFGHGRMIADLAASVLGPTAVAQLVAALPNASGEQAERIATVLGWLRGGEVDRALAPLLDVPGVRRVAAESLARHGASAAPLLLAALESEDAETRKAAAAALGQSGHAAAVPALVALLDDEPDVVVVAAGALGAIGDPRAFDPLIAHLDHSHAAVRQAAVASLNSLAHPDLPARVRALLEDDSPRVRESAARIAGYFGFAECVERLIALCKDEDEGVRRAAVEQLAHLDDPRALPVLVEALHSGSTGVRAAAARGLAHLDAPAALAPVLSALGDPDPWVRYYAARSAGHLRLDDAVPLLCDVATTDEVSPARIAAIEAVSAIGAASAIGALQKLADDADLAIAQPALLALGRMPDDAAATALLRALETPDAERRLAAVTALGNRREGGAVREQARLARADEDEGVRDAAADALATIGGEEAVRALVSLAGEPRRSAHAVVALAGLGEDQIEWVGRGLKHEDVAVRCAVVEALARMRHRTASSLLAEALVDETPVVRLAAAHALGRVDVRQADATLGELARADDDARVRRAAQRALGR